MKAVVDELFLWERSNLMGIEPSNEARAKLAVEEVTAAHESL